MFDSDTNLVMHRLMNVMKAEMINYLMLNSHG